jgi:hypothetical protein
MNQMFDGILLPSGAAYVGSAAGGGETGGVAAAGAEYAGGAGGGVDGLA